jgi:hypothetical protein
MRTPPTIVADMQVAHRSPSRTAHITAQCPNLVCSGIQVGFQRAAYPTIYDCMATEDKPAEEASSGDKNPLPIAEPVPAQSTIKPVNPIEPVAPQGELPTQPTQPQPAGKPDPAPEPLLIRVVDEPSRFERRTITLGWLGLFLGFLSFLAAIIAGGLIYHQWLEMNAQTGFMNRAAIQARKDSADSGIAAANQLTILRGQLTQQTEALRMDQRPWLKFELGSAQAPGDDPGTYTLPLLIVGQPTKIPVRITNIGKTTAERVRGSLSVQIVPDGKEPIIPRHRFVFNLPGEPKARGKSVPGHIVFRARACSHYGQSVLMCVDGDHGSAV